MFRELRLCTHSRSSTSSLLWVLEIVFTPGCPHRLYSSSTSSLLRVSSLLLVDIGLLILILFSPGLTLAVPVGQRRLRLLLAPAPGHDRCRCVSSRSFSRLLESLLIHIVSSPGFILLQAQQTRLFSRLYTHILGWLWVFR